MNCDGKYPKRWVAIKLLEEDSEVEKEILASSPEIVAAAKRMRGELEQLHGHSCPTVVTSERYHVANMISEEIQTIAKPLKIPLSEKLHTLTTHKMFGYPIMLATVLAVFVGIFSFGDFTSALLRDIFFGLKPVFDNVLGTGIVGELVWGGVMEGIIGGVTVALPYILPFYFFLYIFEDSGYLSRIAFLMDNLMHKIGLHGKAFIPVMLSFGCNVPGCLGCRIMETTRERLLTAFVVTLVPCAATSVIILGLVGAYVSIGWALALYIINLFIIYILCEKESHERDTKNGRHRYRWQFVDYQQAARGRAFAMEGGRGDRQAHCRYDRARVESRDHPRQRPPGGVHLAPKRAVGPRGPYDAA